MKSPKNLGNDSEIRLRVVLDGVLDGIITINEMGIVESFNQAAERIFGYVAAEVIGNNIKMLMPEPYRAEHDGYLRNYRSSGVRKIIGIGREVVGKRRDDSTFPMDLAVTEVLLGDERMFIGIVRDITERKQAMLEVNRFKSILDNTLDMIFMFDPETFRFIYLNKGTMASLGFTREELLNMRVWEIKPHMPEHVFRSHVAPLLNGDSPWLNYETAHRCKDGSELPVEVFLQLVEEEGGKRLFVAIARDLTERRKIDKMKSEFISTVSHELRTPLTSIRGALGLVRGGVAGELPAQAKPMIEIAYNNAERLVRLINDILDMEKIESGKMRFEMKVTGLMPLIEQALEANHAYGEQYRVRFTLVGELPGAKVNVDSDRLSQVMANLLSNAAKFSPPGDEVAVRVKAAGAMVRVEVSDHGSGIPDEFRGQIFQKFSQADSSDTKKKGGSGLGLSITKAIVEKMGGVTGFNSVSGQGTTFYFELPNAGEPEQPFHINAVSLQPQILICEDDSEMAMQLRQMMEQRGYRVDVAGSAEEAKSMLAGRHYHAMTLDIDLPGQDGLSLVQELQANEKSAGLPILMISARANEERKRLGDGVKGLDWLDKPVNPDKVFAALREQTGNAVGLPVILHVEDDPDIRQVVKALLGERADVVAAPALASARTLLEKRHFDLVILDIGLPDGSGLDLLALVANNKPAVPILVFSAQEIDSELKLEVNAALVKSRTNNQCLLDTIMAVIAQHDRKA